MIVLKRDAVAKVVLNNLYKHTQLQDTFGANILALVDGVPRTLRLDQMIRHWVAHQISVIVRRTRFLLRKAEERAHILVALLKAIDRIDEVIALIRASASAAAAQRGLMDLLEIDDVQARAILDCSCASWPRWSGSSPTSTRLMAQIADYQAILASRAAAADRRHRAGRDRGPVRRRPAHADHPLRRRHVRRGPDRRGRRGRHDHPRRLRQAHQS